MFASLRLERIGGGGYGLGLFRIPCRAWVAEIGPITLKRTFLRPCLDYSQANSKGTRGVYAAYVLAPERIYEVSSPESWSTTRRYFCHVVDVSIEELPSDILTDPRRFELCGVL